MKLGLLLSSRDGSPTSIDDHDPLYDPSPWLPEHAWERFYISKATAFAEVRDLAHRGCDVFVNLCDGAPDEDRAGLEVVEALERLGLPFTGATASFYEATRADMKAACRAAGLDTPEHVFARDEASIALAAETLRFPLIVKHEDSYCSIGMTRDARVTTKDALVREARRVIAEFGGALIEEFVEGREFTVLVSENPLDPRRPHTYVPVECRFPPGETFKHFDLKWVAYEGIGWFPVTDEVLALRLRDAAARMFVGMSGTGYGRCDLRMDADGALHMLEINPNCGIFYPQGAFGSADIILAHDPIGHRGFLSHLFEVALTRRRAPRTSDHGPSFAVAAAATSPTG
ncbi:MAG: hypothetical protein QM820_30945 [Minicystis sp.]